MAPKLNLLLLLLLLWVCSWARPDAHSVFYNFTITMNGNPWCEFGGQVRGNTFLQYTCSQRAKCDCYRLSMTRKEKETCKEEDEILKYLTEEFPKLLDDMTYPHTLKGEMTCQSDVNGRAFGSWNFYINGNKALQFDLKNKNRTELSREGAQLNNALKNDKYMIGFLLNNSPKMCNSWPEEMRNHQDEESNTTDYPFVCYNFTVTPKPSSGKPWCDIQGQVNGNISFHYDCGSQKVKPFGPLGMKMNDTKAWEKQTETLEDLMEGLKKKLLDIITTCGNRNWTVLYPEGILLNETLDSDMYPHQPCPIQGNGHHAHRLDPPCDPHLLDNWHLRLSPLQ
uniref:UL16-binding protein 6-like isoform X2 n=1 Tax=Pteropus vampyrus TaxID=132908 RepID=UPI00196A932A|nr:UL16-binding protein 6-like isoform X2 [Pteropus giganteus]